MDDGPGDGRRFLLIALGAVWLMAFVYAFVAYAHAPREAAGFPDGLNKPAVYLGWQGIAGIAALAIYGVGLAWEKGSAARRLSKLPILLAFLQGMAILAILFWAGAL
ncbi:MAG: hypothetical protein HKN27_04390 [Silicimonas sp.]|nr:hypothetical protein [Silicimonas sp.]